ncbi:MAG: pirin family protein [Bacteroidia bacterium]|jgi:hypothetical protein|nr:pirin family protein [Bacteroidia bacterium]
MSHVDLIIPERAVQIRQFMVGRLLPFRQKRMVGPFIYIDHMGPVALPSGANIDIGPHPHIGLSTLTFLFEGSIMHRDSIGTVQEIKPGEVNWMTAGKGISHSERTPDYQRDQNKRMHGLQIWVAMPKHLEQSTPSFTHTEAHELPVWQNEAGVQFRLIAGKANGYESPVPVHSPLYLLEIKSTSQQHIELGDWLFGESGLYILEGNITCDNHLFEPKQVLVCSEPKLCGFEMAANTTVYLFGGEPFAEERHIDWNFVSSEPALIDEAKQQWLNGTFPMIEGESEPIPYPVRKQQ